MGNGMNEFMCSRGPFWKSTYNGLAGAEMKILRIWGIPICKMLSDTEFVEKTRKGLRYSKEVVWVAVAALLLVCVLVPMTLNGIWRLTRDNPNETRKWIGTGLLFGFFFGAFAGQYVLSGVHAILTAFDLFDYNRAPRLLIKYRDMLKKVGALGQDDEKQDELGILRTKEVRKSSVVCQEPFRRPQTAWTENAVKMLPG